MITMMMVIVPIITVLSLYIAFVALRTFLVNPKNSTSAFYWGLSFLLLGLIMPLTIAYSSVPIGPMKFALLNVGRHGDNVIGFLQLTAILYSTIWCNRFDTVNCKGCKACKIKIKLAVPVTIMIITTLVGIFLADYTLSPSSMDVTTMYYSVIHFIICILIVYLVFRYRSYGILLGIPYLAIIILNILLPVGYILKLKSNMVEPIVFGFTNAATIVLLLEVLRIVDGLGFKKLPRQGGSLWKK